MGFTGFHLIYILKNDTSIEYIADRTIYIRADFDENGNNYEILPMDPYNLKLYNQGRLHNWCQVMGNNPLLWFSKYDYSD
jgi:palmitoyltransferase